MRGKYQRRHRFDAFDLFVVLAIAAIVLLMIGGALKWSAGAW